MKRRELILATTAGAVGAALAAPALAQGALQWRLSSTWAPNFPFQFAAAERIARRLTQLSGGRLTIEVMNSVDLGSNQQRFDAVRSGEVQMYRSLSYNWRDLSIGFFPFFVMPYGFTETEVGAWIRNLGGQALWDEFYAGYGLKPFLAGALGAQAFGFFPRELQSAADLTGLRYRTTGSTVAIANAAGMRAVDLPPAEIGPAMETGEIDAFELVGPAVDLAFDVHRLAPYYYWPGFHQPSGAVELVVNLDAFEGLPDDLKLLVQTVAEADHHQNAHEVYAANALALGQMTSQDGVQVRRVPDAVLTHLAAATNEVWSALYDSTAGIERRILDSYLAARTTLQQWSAITDRDYLSARAFAEPHIAL
ncbi:TRAP transporter substrate-binding protein [Tabrizicola sp.]|uniref:TRAP transporter substrate-binding protein n=1 Tax=Tabrizicola sp. TaxID=2005166 RepID=UPI003F30DB60